MILNVSVVNKIATYQKRDGCIVCGNSNYKIKFSFDSDWNDHPEKTARFIWKGQYTDVTFTGDICNVPTLYDTTDVEVGVYAGDLKTTTSAQIQCYRSILCLTAKPSVENDRKYANEAKEAADRAEAAAELAATYIPKDGAGIESINYVGDTYDGEGRLVNIYEITFTDGRDPYTFGVANGKDGVSPSFILDTSLTKEGQAADAKAAGDKIKEVDDKLTESNKGFENLLGVMQKELRDYAPYILYGDITSEKFDKAISAYEYGARVMFEDENGNACPSIGLVDDGIRFLKQDTFEVIELKFEDGELKVTYIPFGNSTEDAIYIDLWTDSVVSEFVHADDCFQEPNVIIEYAYSVEGEAGDTYCRYLGRAKDKDGYVSGFRFLDAKHLRIVTVWFATPTSAQKLEFTSLTDDYITITGQSTRAELLNAINSPKQAVFVDYDGQLCYAINETSGTAHFFNASTKEIIYFNVEDFIDEAEVLGRGIRTPLGVESILLDDESTADDITNAINAYRTYGTNVLFTTTHADYATLVAFKERPQKVLYFVTTELSGAKPSVLAVTVGTDGIMTVSRMEIVNRENIVHTVMTEKKMDDIIATATEDDIGSSYLFCGATGKYTHGVIYIIGEEDVNG